MKLPSFAVKHPIFTSMVTGILLLLGGVSLGQLRIDMLPAIELPRASVRVGFDGASPQVMEQQVTQIVEEIIARVPGIEEMSSRSDEGGANISITFAWGTDLDAAVIEVRSAIEEEMSELPDDITRPRVRSFGIEDFPVIILGVSSALDPIEMTNVINNQIRHRFTQIPGIAQLDFWGGFDREVRVELYLEKLNALGIPVGEVVSALRDSNLDLPAGQIEQGRYEVTLRAPAQYKTVQEIQDTVLDMRDGAAVRLGDVADILDTHEKEERIIRLNGEQGVRIAIRKQADANTVEVSREILALIDQLNQEFPQLNIVPVTNQGNFIERSIQNVSQSVLYGAGFAILILLFFLRNIRSTLVIAISIPVSIIATFALIYFGGLTINMMTLGGLALGVGMMVDSSIVVLENIFRRRQQLGDEAHVASAAGAQEVAGAITASTITTLVIFLPVVFMQRVAGQLFSEMAYTIAFSLLCSLLVALTVVPVLASKLVKRSSEKSESRAPEWVRDLSERAENRLETLTQAYLKFLSWALENRLKFAGIVIAMFMVSLPLATQLGSEFLPPSDEGEVEVSGRMEVGTRLDLVDERTRIIEEIVRPAVPEIESYVTSVRENRGEVEMALVPAAERSRSNTEIAAALRTLVEGKIPGMRMRVRAPQGQSTLNRILGAESEGITIEVRGFDLETLETLALRAEGVVAGIPGVSDVDLSFDEGTPQQEIILDRNKIADLGFSPRDATQVIRTAIAGTQAGNFRDEGSAFRILVQLKDAQQRTPDEILGLTLTAPNGDTVALGNLVETSSSRAPLEIQRKNQQRLVQVYVNVAGRDMGSVASDIQAALDSIPRPSGFELKLSGEFEEQQQAFREMVFALLLSLLLVYMVLACQYESLRDPIIVMLSTPMAAIGVVWALWLTGTTLNIQSGVGCIMLGGIVVNNAILLVDQATRLSREGMTVMDAVIEAGRRRFRPILMTTLTTILGLMPLALGLGEGAEAQAPLARAVVGGLAVSTVITLVLIPVVYTLLHRSSESISDPSMVGTLQNQRS